MYKETEIKLPIHDLGDAIRRVESVQGQITTPRHLEDNFLFDQPDGRLAKERMLLRLRIMRDPENPHAEIKSILTFKGTPSTVEGIKEREEIESGITGADNLSAILSNLGFTTTFRYQKYRTVFGLPNVQLHICVDETPIAHYFELEGEILRIHEFATRLGYSRDDYVTQSYASLYYRWCQKTGSQEPHMLFPET